MATPIVANRILGTSFADTLLGLNGSDAIAGREGDDNINGGGGADLLLGNEGDDYMDGGTGQDIMFGGEDDDFLLGGAGGDWLSGDEGVDTLRGGSGADTFYFNANTAGVDGSDTILDFSLIAGDKLAFGKYAGTNALIFVQNGTDVEVYVDLGGDTTADYLAVTVHASTVADVSAASSFVM
jgi:Ca2+-binding RTX toxin-like protein